MSTRLRIIIAFLIVVFALAIFFWLRRQQTPTISVTGQPTVSAADCASENFKVTTIIKNNSNQRLVLTGTAPTQDKVTMQPIPSAVLNPNGFTTVVAIGKLDDVCEQGTVTFLFVAGRASAATLPTTVPAHPIQVATLSAPDPVEANPDGEFSHSVTFECCAAGGNVDFEWMVRLSTRVVGGKPPPAPTQACGAAGPPPVTVISTDGKMLSGANDGISGHQISEVGGGGTSCVVKRDVIRLPPEEEE